MRYQMTSISTTLMAMLGMAGAAAVYAAGSPRSDDHARRSLAMALGQRELPVLIRRSMRTPEATLATLTRSLTRVNRSFSTEKASEESERGRILLVGKDWRLAVFRDGSAAEFVNYAAVSRAHNIKAEPSRAMTLAQLEPAGRDFIARSLADTIMLGPAERFEPEATARTEGGVAADGTSAYSAVAANRIVFTREIDGVPVVGAGSKVTITFLNDGSVESFRYDWPQYTPTERIQATVDVAEILKRVQKVAGIRSDRDFVPRPNNVREPEPGPAPVELGGNAALQRLACGYYDPGVIVREADAPVQAGCYYHVVYTRGEGDFITRAARSGAVPAARQFEADRSWPEAAMLSGVDGSPASNAPERPVAPRE